MDWRGRPAADKPDGNLSISPLLRFRFPDALTQFLYGARVFFAVVDPILIYVIVAVPDDAIRWPSCRVVNFHEPAVRQFLILPKSGYQLVFSPVIGKGQ